MMSTSLCQQSGPSRDHDTTAIDKICGVPTRRARVRESPSGGFDADELAKKYEEVSNKVTDFDHGDYTDCRRMLALENLHRSRIAGYLFRRFGRRLVVGVAARIRFFVPAIGGHFQRRLVRTGQNARDVDERENVRKVRRRLEREERGGTSGEHLEES